MHKYHPDEFLLNVNKYLLLGVVIWKVFPEFGIEEVGQEMVYYADFDISKIIFNVFFLFWPFDEPNLLIGFITSH